MLYISAYQSNLLLWSAGRLQFSIANKEVEKKESVLHAILLSHMQAAIVPFFCNFFVSAAWQTNFFLCL